MAGWSRSKFITAAETTRPAPQLKAEYVVARKGAEPESWRDVTSLVKFAGPHCRIARMVSLSRLHPGEYEMRVRIRDKISGQSASAAAPFRIVR